MPDAKTYEGRDAVIEAWEDWPKQWEDFRLDLIEIIDVSDDVLISVTRHRGRGRESGIEMDFEGVLRAEASPHPRHAPGDRY